MNPSDKIDIIKDNTRRIHDLINQFGIDSFGIASLSDFKEKPNEIPLITSSILKNYTYAIVLGARFRKTGKHISGQETSMSLEVIGLKLMDWIVVKEKHAALIVHTEDEIDPANRFGILSLKALAKSAGLGWQGRSLLIISPKYGPMHRLIAILTDMPLVTDLTILNQCGDCRICVDKCPTGALNISTFTDHPGKREDILDLTKCLGDNGCQICIRICPWWES